MEKNSYKRRIYESVDDRSLSQAISRKLKEKLIQVMYGLRNEVGATKLTTSVRENTHI